VSADQPERDLARFQELDQVGPGHIQELRRPLRGQLGRVGDDINPFAARQEPQDLGEQDGRSPRDDQNIITRELALDLVPV
jgi:hypothetical protein